MSEQRAEQQHVPIMSLGECVEAEGGGPVLKSFSKEQLQGRAIEFLRLQLGDVRTMALQDQRAYHEITGILMFYINHLWKPFS